MRLEIQYLEIQYKGFSAKLIFSPETDTFNAEVLNVDDVLAFQVSHPVDAFSAMRETIECYLNQMVAKELA
jgi:predicted HicB family RNase H-like nuclease